LDNCRIDGLAVADGQVVSASCGATQLLARAFVVATGGQSYPATGSDGSAWTWLGALGHTVIAPVPGLAPIILKESWLVDLAGTALESVELEFAGQVSAGELLFTHQGLSGPAALNLSKHLSRVGFSTVLSLRADFLPNQNEADFLAAFAERRATSPKISLVTFLSGFLPKKLVLAIVHQAKLAGDVSLADLSHAQLRQALTACKSCTLRASGVGGFDKAMVTCGGVDIRQVSSSDMRSKLWPNLFLAGEVLDIDGPTGGYNLQACWSTGFLAGSQAAEEAGVGA
jgi:predicted Rossmann fold flavoprotein